MKARYLDQPSAVRPGEELPVDRLAAYLQEHLPEQTGELSVQQFPSGHSNLTFLVRLGEQEMVLRRPPYGAKIKTAHDMGREFFILSRLRAVYECVPRPLLYCEDESVIGAPFYVMQRVQGTVLRAETPAGFEPTPDFWRALSTVFVDNLVEIHAVDYAAAGLEELGKPAGYCERQVRGWTERYLHARTDDIPEIERVAGWLADRLPPAEASGTALIHNDYKYDNLVLDLAGPESKPRITAVLDWEMATIGDPLMDLGTSLGYWVEENDPEELRQIAFGLTMLPGNFTREEIVQRYARVSGRDVSNIKFYYVYALFKIAVIIQQIYNRWNQGLTSDDRFAGLIKAVHILGRTAARASEL